MSDKGQIFTLDMSIASLFLLAISMSIIWISTYSFNEQSHSIENAELVTYGKITYAEVLDRIYLEEAVVSTDNFVFDGASILRKLGINNSYSFHLELRDIDDNIIKTSGMQPPAVTDVFALTAPVLVQNGSEYTHAILYYRFWRRTEAITRGNLTVITLAEDNSSFWGITVNVTSADGKLKLVPKVTNVSGEVKFRGVPPGDYIINASFGVFHWEVEDIQIEAGKRSSVTIYTKLLRSS